MYATLTSFFERFFKKSTIFKYGFNWSPMYRRTTAKIYEMSDDLMVAKVKIAKSYKNKNYVGTIFGGSLFSATDPIYMIQLMQILGKSYVVWDKAATIKYRRPASSDAYVDFIFSQQEIEQIKQDVAQNGEIDLIKELTITNKDKSVVFCELSKTVYIADKQFYKDKRKKREEAKNSK